MEEGVKPYWQQLTEEYEKMIPYNPEEDIDKWYNLHTTQRNTLLSRYGESTWRIQEFMELVRAEKISEGKFRDLVRFEIDKCFSRLNRDS